MKEPTGSKSYILNTSRISESELELAGERALNLSSLAKIGAPTPSGFVVTSKVFDDFLFANNLIPEITNINAHLMRGQISPKRAHVLIKNLIAKGSFPNLILEMLYRAHNLLVVDKNVTLQLFPSALNPQLKESMFNAEKQLIAVEGFEDFLIKLKSVWLQLFTPEVLEYRVKTKYKGIISTAVVVNKFVQPEISGTAYTLSVENANPDIIELRSIYGIGHEVVWKEDFSDRYLYQRSTEQLLGKTVNKQGWMLVLKNSKLQKLQISPSRQKEQKLNDIQIVTLAKISSNLKNHFRNELKVDWQFQAGKFTFTNLTRLREQEILEARKTLSVAKTTNEVKAPPAVISNPLTENFQLQPIDRLTRILSGQGNSRGIIYGRIKQIRSSADLDKVKGVNILVMKKPLKNMKVKQVQYRGLIVENPVDQDLQIPTISGATDASNLLLENEIVTIDTDSGHIYLGAGYIPVVTPVAEKVVDTFRPDTVNAKEIKLTMQRPVSSGIFRPVVTEAPKQSEWLPEQKVPVTPTIEKPMEVNFPEQKVENPLVETKEIARQIDDEWYLKSPEYKDLLKFQESGCEYWQNINLENPLVLEKTKGVCFKLSNIARSLDIDVYELRRNKPLQRRFVGFCSQYLSQYDESESVLVVCDIEETSKSTLEEDGVLEIQLDVVKQLRNKLNMKNVSIILPDIKNEKELISMKKLITANGLRRSATFNVICEIVSPLAVISVQKIIDEGVDGVVLDLDKLLCNLAGEDRYKLSPEIAEFLVEVIEKINSTTVPVYIGANEIVLNDDHLERFLQSGAFKFVFPEAKIRELGPIMSNMEVKILTKKPAKRGRRKKDINYG